MTNHCRSARGARADQGCAHAPRGRRAKRDATLASYIDALRADLTRADEHLVGPEVVEEFFKVACRDARYFHRFTRKFYLHPLTVLRPVGK